MKDYFDNEINIGDYICYQRIVGRSTISVFVGKVIKFNPQSISIMCPNWCGYMGVTSIYCPDRAIVISEELALQKEPRFKKDMDDPCCNCKYLGQLRAIAIEPPECDYCGAPDYVCWDV